VICDPLGVISKIPEKPPTTLKALIINNLQKS
jgi:hypothetical protein